MKQLNYTFSKNKVSYFLDADFSYLENIVSREQAIIITDENVHRSLGEKCKGYKTVVIPAGEQHKNQSTVDSIIQQLISLEADRKTVIIGVGGGVVTDIAGFTASIYMRGLKFGFVPTTVLAQVDAAIGGKNGIDAGVYKNMIGVIRQPEFILFDFALLQSLPVEQWINGFAEIIKHGCIKDAGLFDLLERHQLKDFQQSNDLLADLIEQNVIIKSDVVQEDEFEQGSRKLLNFGHTIGHAIENLYQLPHGHAISIGMAGACTISQEVNGLLPGDKERVLNLLQQYHLPVSFLVDNERVFRILKMDKKRVRNEISFILLTKIGEAVAKPIPLPHLQHLIADAI
ncbi:MAG: 3-dehydroquinate synthase [Chitinophagaceae bacterium]